MSTLGIGQMNQLGDSLEKHNFTADEIQRLRGILGDVQRVLHGQAEIVIKPIDITVTRMFSEIGMVTIPATSEVFRAKDHFVCDTDENSKVKISYLGNNFKKWFLAGEGKIELVFGGSEMIYYKLEDYSLNTPIIAELGGEAKCETTLTEIFSLMAQQSNGEKGVLLNNGWGNIFYVRDINGVLHAVNILWLSVGWRVSADSVEHPNKWERGCQVFSRNSVSSTAA